MVHATGSTNEALKARHGIERFRVKGHEGHGVREDNRRRFRNKALKDKIPRAEPERNKSGRSFGEQGVERVRNPEGARPDGCRKLQGSRLQKTGKTLKGIKPR
jgi:hypothetical protein